MDKKVEQEIADVLKKHKAKLGYMITFPIYKILPDEVKLALSVLAKHKMNIEIIFESLKKEKQ